MKVYVSVDMEAVTGINHWDEATKGHPDYQEFRQQMTAETVAACHGALAAGASEVVVNDSHGTCRNILSKWLPEQTTLIRGWSGHPHGMVQNIDESFDAALFVGYHARAGSGGG